MIFGLIAAVGFASGWMLLWAAAAAIPVVLHFLYRRRQVAVRWAAMRLLLQVVEQEAKRVHLEQILLLLLRTLILLIMAVALARPYWDRGDIAPATDPGAPAAAWILLIDVSYSMGYRADNETRLQAAQRRAIEIVESAREGDAFALVELGAPARALIARPTFDRQAMLNEIRRLTLNDAGCDLSSGLQLVSDIARSVKQEEGLPPTVQIVVLSDLGRDRWQSAVDGVDAKILRSLAENYQLEIESYGNEEISNVAITSIEPSTSRTVVGLPVEVDVTVANFGSSAMEQLPIELAVDGQTVSSQQLSLAGEVSMEVRFSVTLKSTGYSVLTATIAADRLATDNSRRHVIDVRDDYRVLIVEQRLGDSRLLSLSLRPERSASQVWHLSTISALDLPVADLSTWQVIVLNDLPSIDSAIYAKLERFVRQGGALICLWGPRTNAAMWNARQANPSLLGFEFLEPSPIQYWGIDPLDYQSPIVAPFSGFPDAGLLTTPIFRFWKIKRSEGNDSDWKVDLATTEGDPLIVRHRIGEGAVVSVLSSPQSGAATSDAWNAMATWPSFVPLMQRLIQAAIDTGAENHTIQTGRPLMGKDFDRRKAAERGSQLITIIKPDVSESQIATAEVTVDGASPWEFLQTQQSGVYMARDGSGNEQPYVANIDPVESPLRSIGRAELPTSSVPQQLAIHSDEAPARAKERRPILIRGLLIGLGLLLVAESLLAWAMGRRAA